MAREAFSKNADGSSDSSDGQVEDFNWEEVWKDLEESGWFKSRKKLTDETEYDLEDPKTFIDVIFGYFSKRRSRHEKAAAEEGKEFYNERIKASCEKILEELKLLREYEKKQADPAIDESTKQNMLVPYKKHTSLDPDTQWRLDNSKCSCGLCHQFSGVKDKTCWVFEKLGCDFSLAVRKFFHSFEAESICSVSMYNSEFLT